MPTNTRHRSCLKSCFFSEIITKVDVVRSHCLILTLPISSISREESLQKNIGSHFFLWKLFWLGSSICVQRARRYCSEQDLWIWCTFKHWWGFRVWPAPVLQGVAVAKGGQAAAQQEHSCIPLLEKGQRLFFGVGKEMESLNVSRGERDALSLYFVWKYI